MKIVVRILEIKLEINDINSTQNTILERNILCGCIHDIGPIKGGCIVLGAKSTLALYLVSRQL
jgi:hypothetical protein